MASTTEKSIEKCPACYFGERDCHAYRDGHCIALSSEEEYNSSARRYSDQQAIQSKVI